MSEQLCVVCLERPPYGRSLVCGGDFARMRGDLATVQWAYSWLGATMLALPASWKPGTIHRAAAAQPPMSMAMHDVRVDIHDTLASWARMIAEEHTPALHGPVDDTVPAIAVWLRARLQWCSDQPWCDQYALALTVLRQNAYALAPWDRSRIDLPLPCPKPKGCGLLTLALYSGDDGVTCRNRACGRTITVGDYYQAVRAEWTKQTDLQRATVAA